VAAGCAIAALAVTASARADTPLVWSAPEIIAKSAPFAEPTDIRDISCPSAALCVAVDAEGYALTSTNPADLTSYDKRFAHGSQDYRAFTGVSCPSASLCVAVDGLGRAFASTDPDAGSWGGGVFVDYPQFRPLNDVSCPSASLCVAVDTAGNVATTKQPTGGPDGWHVANIGGSTNLKSVECPSSSLCVASNDAGDIFTSTDPDGGAGAWKRTDLDGTAAVTAIDCPSTDLCLAVRGGTALISEDPTGGPDAWKPEPVPATDLTEVSCASESFCVFLAVSGKVFVSSDPSSAASTWKETLADANQDVRRLSCPTASLCVAVGLEGRMASSTNPGAATPAWSAADVDGINVTTDVSCPSIDLCVAVDTAGHVITSTDPAGGPATWSSASVAPTLATVSCPSESFCAATYGTKVYTSTNPTGGAAAWSSATDLGGDVTIEDLSCASQSLCVGVGGKVGVFKARVFSSTNPTGGPLAWKQVDVDGPYQPAVVDCPADALCLAGDSQGNFFSSTEPNGDASKWTVVDPAAGQNGMSGISCPSAAFCVAVADLRVFHSTNPSGDAVDWQAEEVARQGLRAVHCASSTLCVATSIDDGFPANAVAFTTTTPTGGASAWTATKVDPFTPNLAAVSCPSTGLCLIVDDRGNAVVGTARPPRQTLAVAKAGNGSGAVASSPAGIACGATCSHAYDEGTQVTLTATPAADSTFTAWGGACGGAGACQVTMSQARSVTATFVKKRFPLTVTRLGGGAGTVTSSPAGINCGAACSHAYYAGTKVTLHAAPASGSKLKGWGGACSGTGACNVTLSGARSVSATFVRVVTKPATLARSTVTASKGGDVTLRVQNPNAVRVLGDVKLTMKVRQGGKTKTVQIGHAAFAVPAHGVTKVKVHLSDRARTRLKNRGRLSAVAKIVLAANGTSKTSRPAVTINAPHLSAAARQAAYGRAR